MGPRLRGDDRVVFGFGRGFVLLGRIRAFIGPVAS